MTYAKRVDSNQREIVEALRTAGYFVADTHMIGNGFPDILVVGKDDRVVLFEIKMPNEKLTQDEVKFFSVYPGRIAIVHNFEEALAVLS